MVEKGKFGEIFPILLFNIDNVNDYNWIYDSISAVSGKVLWQQNG